MAEETKISDIVVEITAKNLELRKGLKEAEAEVKKAAERMEKSSSFQTLKGLGSSISGGLRVAALATTALRLVPSLVEASFHLFSGDMDKARESLNKFIERIPVVGRLLLDFADDFSNMLLTITGVNRSLEKLEKANAAQRLELERQLVLEREYGRVRLLQAQIGGYPDSQVARVRQENRDRLINIQDQLNTLAGGDQPTDLLRYVSRLQYIADRQAARNKAGANGVVVDSYNTAAGSFSTTTGASMQTLTQLLLIQAKKSTQSLVAIERSVGRSGLQ